MEYPKPASQLWARRVFGGVAIVVLVVVVTILTNVLWLGRPSGTSGGGVGEESVYDRVVRTGTIRCGYVSNPPSCIVDPNTGELSGIFVDAIEATAANLDLKIEWTEEVGFGSMIEGLRAGRYDMVPCAIWPNAARSRHVDFSDPLFYSAVGVFVRKDDDRFANNLSAINSPAVKIATIDGEMAAAITRADFPEADTLELPQLSDIATMLLNVKDGKADVSFVELFFAHEFLENNPGSIKNITPAHPIRVFPNTVLLPQGDHRLKSMINTALHELINLGVVDRLIDRYEPSPGIFYRVDSPFEVPSGAQG